MKATADDSRSRRAVPRAGVSAEVGNPAYGDCEGQAREVRSGFRLPQSNDGLELGARELRRRQGVWRRSGQLGQSHRTSRHGGEDRSPFEDRTARAQLRVLNAAQPALPHAMKVLDAPAERVSAHNFKHVAASPDGVGREKGPLDSILAAPSLVHQHGVELQAELATGGRASHVNGSGAYRHVGGASSPRLGEVGEAPAGGSFALLRGGPRRHIDLSPGDDGCMREGGPQPAGGVIDTSVVHGPHRHQQTLGLRKREHLPAVRPAVHLEPRLAVWRMLRKCLPCVGEHIAPVAGFARFSPSSAPAIGRACVSRPHPLPADAQCRSGRRDRDGRHDVHAVPSLSPRPDATEPLFASLVRDRQGRPVDRDEHQPLGSASRHGCALDSLAHTINADPAIFKESKRPFARSARSTGARDCACRLPRNLRGQPDEPFSAALVAEPSVPELLLGPLRWMSSHAR